MTPSGGSLIGTQWTTADRPRRNLLRASLPPDAYERLQPRLVLVELALNEQLWEKDGVIPHVYFPLNGVVSILAIMADGESVEVGTVG